MSLMTVAPAGIAAPADDVLEPLSADEVEPDVELELVDRGAPPHPAKINASKPRPASCSRINSSSRDEAAQRHCEGAAAKHQPGKNLRQIKEKA
jgi:hypothetical protein